MKMKSKLADQRHRDIRKLETEKGEKAKRLTKSQEALRALELELLTHTNLATERRQEIDGLKKERKLEVDRLKKERKLEVEGLKKERNLEVEGLKKERNLEVDRALEFQSKLVFLEGDNEAQIKLSTERHQEIRRLLKKNDDHFGRIIEYKRKLELLELERDKYSVIVENHQEQLLASRKQYEILEEEMLDKDHCQRLLDEELVKAEAQIELIKDVLIRDKMF